MPEDSEDLLTLSTTPAEPAPKRHRRTKRVLLVLAGLVGTLLIVVVGGFFYLTGKLGDNVQRVPKVFDNLDQGARPPTSPALTFLLVGTDTRAPGPTTGTGAQDPDFVPGRQRSDVIMIVRFDEGRTHASVVSIPRDAWVPIPGRGNAKINAAYSFGGPALLVQTVEALTRIRIDHFAIIDFAGFQEMTDAVGGIDVRVAQATSAFGSDFHQGLNHLNGEQALSYVRQRYDLPRGDLDRAQRHQAALRALLDSASNAGLLSSPATTYGFLDAVTRSVSVDDSLDNGGLRSLALELRGLRSDSVAFGSAPVGALGMEGDQAVDYLDADKSAELWRALGEGNLGTYLDKYPSDMLAAIPP